MLLLKQTPLDTILSMQEMIEAIEDALKEWAEGRGFDLPRRRIHHSNRMIFGILAGLMDIAVGRCACERLRGIGPEIMTREKGLAIEG